MNNLWSISRTPLPFLQIPPPPPPSLITYSCFSKSQNLRFLNKKKINSLPARDRVIDFGKYKGKMLGTLPSTYLKWVSKNLRARDFEEWAQLADEVLEDPVYKDRIEWEFAQKVLKGDVLKRSSSSSSLRSGRQAAEEESSVDELAEISERFGWDNEDKVGWAKVDFGLLGTSGGGRIPRLSASSGPICNLTMGSVLTPSGPRPIKENPKRTVRDVGEKRRERMERMKLRRNSTKLEEEEDRGSNNKEGKFGNSLENCNKEVEKKVSSNINTSRSLFPGRDALLEKMLLRRNKAS